MPFVDTECGDDAALRADVLELLLHAGEAGDTLDAPALNELAPDLEPAIEDSIGPYRLIAALGQGGMGRVHRALGPDGAVVALKTIRPGLLSGALLSRFARECEVLRRLDHPGIARFVDAGVADTARGPV